MDADTAQVAISGVFIPIVAIFGIFAFLIFRGLFRSRERQRLYDTVKIILERGEAIPPDLSAALRETSQPRMDLRSGLIWIAIGLGTIIVGVFLMFEDGEVEVIWPVFGGASVPLLIGAALVIMSRMKVGRD